jgi:hypothetical protein
VDEARGAAQFFNNTYLDTSRISVELAKAVSELMGQVLKQIF